LPAATLLLLRDGPQGIEVLMTRRASTASFAPGAYVFPGGGIDNADTLAFGCAKRRDMQSDTALTQAIAAIRESFEELGILLARHANGQMASAADIAALDRHAAQGDFAPQCAAHGLTLAADEVFVLAHWITDRDLPRRFDVPFLVARMPDAQTPVADEKEQFAPEWVRPADALSRHAQGNFFIIYPTIKTLERLQSYASVDSVLADCASEQPWFTSCPRAGWLGGKEVRYMEHEAPFGELALTCPDGQMLHHLDWVTDQPVLLLKNVQRLTAPNPGVMTRNQQLFGRRPRHRLRRHRSRPCRQRTPRPFVACRRRQHSLHRVHPFAPRPLAGCCAAASPVCAAWAHAAHSGFGFAPNGTRCQCVHT
jgi:8-oxo-dGTP pyrophosphatase MutT (NUDIX family)